MKRVRLAMVGVVGATLVACAGTSAEAVDAAESALGAQAFVSEETADGTRLHVQKVTLVEGTVSVGFFDTQLGEKCTPRETMQGLRCVPDRVQPIARERNYMHDYQVMDSFFTDESCTQAALELPQNLAAATCEGAAKLVIRENHADTYCRSGDDELAIDVYRVDSATPVPAETKIYMRRVFGGCSPVWGPAPRVYPATKLTKDLVSFAVEPVEGRGRLRPERLVGADKSVMWSQRTLRDREIDVPCETDFDPFWTVTNARCRPLESVTAPARYSFALDSACKNIVRGAYDNCGHQPKVAKPEDGTGRYFLTQPLPGKLYEPIGTKECREAGPWSASTFYPLGNEKPLAETTRQTVGSGRIRERVLVDADGQSLNHVALFDSLLGAEVAPERMADGKTHLVPVTIPSEGFIAFEDEAMQKPVVYDARSFGNVRLARDAVDGCGRGGAIYTETGDAVEFATLYFRPRGHQTAVQTSKRVQAKRATLVDPQFFAIAEGLLPTAATTPDAGSTNENATNANATGGAAAANPGEVGRAAPAVTASESGGCQTNGTTSFGNAWLGFATVVSAALARRKRATRA